MKITFWGPKSSGKTTYLAMVYGIALKSAINWIIAPGDEASTIFIKDQINLIRKGNFPIPSQDQATYIYEITPGYNLPTEKEAPDLIEVLRDFLSGADIKKGDVEDFSPLTINFVDVPGEFYLSKPLEDPLWEDLENSDGLICLINPADTEKSFEYLFQLLHFLKIKCKESGRLIHNKLPHYIALCFSQIDQPQFREYINKPKEIVKLLEEKDMFSIEKILLQSIHLDRLKIITVSSVGTECGASDGTIANPGKINPINVLQPLKWFFEKMGK